MNNLKYKIRNKLIKFLWFLSLMIVGTTIGGIIAGMILK
jgi:hypothetical protein